jgi:hypothetical protein
MIYLSMGNIQKKRRKFRKYNYNRKPVIRRKQNIYHSILVIRMNSSLFSKKKGDRHISLKLK